MARGGGIKVLPLYMEPPITTGGPTDIVMGGCAPVNVTLSGVTNFCYFPSSIHSVTTYGDAFITVTAGGLLCVDYKVPPFGVVTGGQANITTTLNGVTEFCYFPSEIHTITTSGDALIVVEAGGLLCVDYKVAPHGVILGGQANVTTTLDGVTQFCYFPTCGVTMGGEAVVDFTSFAKERGGKGTPMFRRERQDQATHFYFKAEAFFEHTLQISGEASAEFKPAPYQFIKSLPKVERPDPKRDSEFVDLFKKLVSEPQKTKFVYRAEGGITAQGTADDEYFDFLAFILAHDEDLIVSDILSDDGFPIITTTFDKNLAQQKREDEELFELLELL